eukprot:CAMPEP_0203766716 /NCGR_PEP_ID=MMETSP0099_2-20121227/577_1 /ASSEMBLY_ACC=CAM_ASM_000209 /TAXON_ID=96639 /ORGANISM=" , Strain NY0313808BC1" /LENGTH=73 /DNA_ID=CAMNT_0050663107 /DNA_START=252 /DNA_END=473 /DNA_ORIENTATION=+
MALLCIVKMHPSWTGRPISFDVGFTMLLLTCLFAPIGVLIGFMYIRKVEPGELEDYAKCMPDMQHGDEEEDVV